jgi:hypothetical protein
MGRSVHRGLGDRRSRREGDRARLDVAGSCTHEYHGFGAQLSSDGALENSGTYWHFLAAFGEVSSAISSCSERTSLEHKLSICWVLCQSYRPGSSHPWECQKGIVGAPSVMGQKSARAQTVGRGPNRRDAATQIVSPSALAIQTPRSFSLLKPFIADGAIAAQLACAVSLHHLYIIYGVLRISLMHLYPGASAT